MFLRSMTGNPVCIQINLSDNTELHFSLLFQAVQMWEPEIPCLLFWAQTFLSWSRRQWKVLTPLPQPSSPQYLTLGLPPRGLLQHSMQALWCNNYVQLEGRMKSHLMEHRIDRQMGETFQHRNNTCNHHARAACFVYRKWQIVQSIISTYFCLCCGITFKTTHNRFLYFLM